MKAVKAKITRGIPVGAVLSTCDNSGAKKVRIFSVKGHNTVKGRIQSAGVGDMVQASVKKGKPEMKKQVVFGVIVRQKKEFRRPNGTRIKFEDNSIVILKDEEGNPKGTLVKGPIAKEVADRWPAVARLASIIV